MRMSRRLFGNFFVMVFGFSILFFAALRSNRAPPAKKIRRARAPPMYKRPPGKTRPRRWHREITGAILGKVHFLFDRGGLRSQRAPTRQERRLSPRSERYVPPGATKHR